MWELFRDGEWGKAKEEQRGIIDGCKAFFTLAGWYIQISDHGMKQMQ